MTAAVYGRLKRELTTARLGPGTELHEGAVAARYGVSKTPVREALGVLAQQGWVRVQPRRGYSVCGISLGDVRDVYQLRLLVEPQAAALAAQRLGPAAAEDLRALGHILYRHGDTESHSAFLVANREFHTAVARASGNRRLGDVVERLLEEMERIFHVGLASGDFSAEMVHEHDDLVAALTSGDAAAAERIMREQIVESRRRVLDALMGGAGAAAVTVSIDAGAPRPRRRAGAA